MLKADILIVDDDPALAEMLTLHLDRAGYRATSSSTLEEGVCLARNGAFDVIFLDVQMPDGNGLHFFSRFAEAPSRPEVIIMTGSGDPDRAKKAIQLGAWSYLEKPYILREMLLPLTRALQYREEKKKISVMPVALKRDGIIGKSPSLRPCLDQLAKAAISDANLLITGETGTGKEVFARAVHDNSERNQQAFVVVDCTSLPETLIESALFGHVKGAFTGADRTVNGLIKMADGGTLFLDEIGEMSERIQKSLLRVLQERRFRPVGATREESSDFRVIAATNRNLDQFVDKGLFRADLLYRLRSLTLHLPPLRERKEDIRLLTRYFLARLCDRARIATKGMADEFFDYLAAYQWPGNVRELQQTMEQVFANAVHHPTLFPNHLPAHIRVCKTLAGMKPAISTEPPAKSISSPVELVAYKTFKANNEVAYLVNLAAITNGNIKEMCRISGLSRARLYQLLSLHEIEGASVIAPADTHPA